MNLKEKIKHKNICVYISTNIYAVFSPEVEFRRLAKLLDMKRGPECNEYFGSSEINFLSWCILEYIWVLCIHIISLKERLNFNNVYYKICIVLKLE